MSCYGSGSRLTRYVTLLRCLQVRDMTLEGVTRGSGHGSARGHRESATSSRDDADDSNCLPVDSCGDSADAGSVLVTTSVCPPNGIGGWACQLIEGDGRRYPIEAGISTNTTPNRVALESLIRGLEELSDNRRLAVRPVEIVTDSDYVRAGVERIQCPHHQRRWIRSGGVPLTNIDLWQRVAVCLGDLRCSIRRQG